MKKLAYILLILVIGVLTLTACSNYTVTVDTVDEETYFVINGETTDVLSNGQDPSEATLTATKGGYLVINGIKTTVKKDGTSDFSDENPQGLGFFLKDDGTYAVEIGAAKNQEKIVIPSTYNNTEVTEVSSFGHGSVDNTVLKEIVIPSGVTVIANNAFKNCTSLVSITIPDTVTEVGSDAFMNCGKLQVEISDLNSWVAVSFRNAYSNPLSTGGSLYLDGSLVKNLVIDGIEKISSYAFYGCSSIEIVTLSADVKEIGSQAFASCNNFKTLNVEDLSAFCGISYPLLDANPLYYAHNLSVKGREITELVIPSDVNEISKFAFAGASFKKVVIVDKVEKIGLGAFQSCDSITGMTLSLVGGSKDGSENGHFGYIFGASTPEENPSYVPQSIKNIVIDGLCRVADSAFLNCTGINNVTVNYGIAGIGFGAFEGCNSIREMTLDFIGAEKDAETNNHFGYIFGASHSALNSDFVPKSIKTVTVKNCTEIADSAFYGCSGLVNVTVNVSVKSVGKHAFGSCSSLENITLPFVGAELLGSENTHFGYVFGADSYADNHDYVPRSLKTVTITSGSKVGSYAFIGCNNIISVSLPASVTEIGIGAFHDCSSLADIVLPFVGNKKDGVENSYLGYIFEANDPFFNNTYVPKSLKSVVITGGSFIDDFAFRNCSSLASVTLPDSIVKIGECAFYECSGLTNINIGKNLCEVEENAFKFCDNLKSVIISDLAKWVKISFASCESNPLYYAGNLYVGKNLAENISVGQNDGISEICAYAFAGATCIKNVEISAGVTKIGFGAFANCSSLLNITLPFIGNMSDGEENTHLGYIFGADNAFANKSCIPTSLTNVVITGGEQVADYAFYGAESLKTITIAESVTEIGNFAFNHCISLESLTLPDSVTAIGEYAFSGCTSLAYNYFDGAHYIGNSENPYLVLVKATNVDVTEIIINRETKIILSYAFDNCEYLAFINYVGNSYEWDSIFIGENGNDVIVGVTVEFDYVPEEK